MNKNKKISLYSVLHNDKALLVLSFIMAFFVWTLVSLNESPEVERVVEHVKVNIDDNVPKQLGYEAFCGEDLYIDLTVRGKRYLVGDNVLKAEDFKVTALTSGVKKPGCYSLQLKAVSKDPHAEYDIISKSKNFIDVYFDERKTVEMPVEAAFVCDDEELLYSDDYMTDAPFASVEKLSITGPAKEIRRVKQLRAEIKTEGRLKMTETIPAELSFIDAYGKAVSYVEPENPDETITVTIPVFLKQELPVTVDFKNTPLHYIESPLSVKCEPSRSVFAVESGKVGSLNAVSLGKINFSELAPGLNSFELELSDTASAFPANRTQKFKVSIDTGDVETRELIITADRFKTVGRAKGFRSSVAPGTSLRVTAVGPEEELAKLKAENITAVVELKNVILKPGRNRVPAELKIKGNDYCWIYGSYEAVISAVSA